MRKTLSLLALLAGSGLLAASALGSASQSPPANTFRWSLAVDIDHVDPALAYYTPSWAIEYATGAMLFNYPDAPAPRGARLVPEVAAGFPAISSRRAHVHVSAEDDLPLQRRTPRARREFRESLSAGAQPPAGDARRSLHLGRRSLRSARAGSPANQAQKARRRPPRSTGDAVLHGHPDRDARRDRRDRRSGRQCRPVLHPGVDEEPEDRPRAEPLLPRAATSPCQPHPGRHRAPAREHQAQHRQRPSRLWRHPSRGSRRARRPVRCQAALARPVLRKPGRGRPVPRLQPRPSALRRPDAAREHQAQEGDQLRDRPPGADEPVRRTCRVGPRPAAALRRFAGFAMSRSTLADRTSPGLAHSPTARCAATSRGFSSATTARRRRRSASSSRRISGRSGSTSTSGCTETASRRAGLAGEASRSTSRSNAGTWTTSTRATSRS